MSHSVKSAVGFFLLKRSKIVGLSIFPNIFVSGEYYTEQYSSGQQPKENEKNYEKYHRQRKRRNYSICICHSSVQRMKKHKYVYTLEVQNLSKQYSQEIQSADYHSVDGLLTLVMKIFNGA